ncbi:hypothetical protein [Pseudomonas anguilliseptica]|uniref:hypothetical protein n=1 Tax=Pseudomonas anguilliseptica TaxID=53406 RepID=UPI0022B0346B|nr:hypothetical protein [Pseudomonas anguilliseptica]MCZ4321456.1 hypothetical protein [Pseudomonas anguilliseptica]
MYRLTESPEMVTRLSDGASIPTGHRWWDEYQAWLSAGNTPEPVESKSPEQVADKIQAELTIALNKHLDSVAGERRYDSRFTCSLRAGFPGPFQAEGLAFAAFMDECNMVGYTMMKRAKAGEIPIPTDAELIAAMPVMVWPPSPIPEGAV